MTSLYPDPNYVSILNKKPTIEFPIIICTIKQRGKIKYKKLQFPLIIIFIRKFYLLLGSKSPIHLKSTKIRSYCSLARRYRAISLDIYRYRRPKIFSLSDTRGRDEIYRSITICTGFRILISIHLPRCHCFFPRGALTYNVSGSVCQRRTTTRHPRNPDDCLKTSLPVECMAGQLSHTRVCAPRLWWLSDVEERYAEEPPSKRLFLLNEGETSCVDKLINWKRIICRFADILRMLYSRMFRGWFRSFCFGRKLINFD